MGLRKILFIILSVSLLISPLFCVRAAEKQTNVFIAADKVVDDDLFVGGNSVVIRGTINGDVYTAGGSVTIDGKVNGDILAAGGTILISGEVKDDVRAAGGTITIHNATIGESVSVAGGNITIDDTTTIGGGLVGGGGMLTTNAKIGRGIMGGAGSATIGGSVGKNIMLGAESLTILPNTKIAGDLTYTSSQKAIIDTTSSIVGETRQILPKIEEKKSAFVAHSKPQNIRFGFHIWSFFAASLFGIVLLYFFGKEIDHIVGKLQKNPMGTLGWGFVISIVTIPALFIIAATVVGIPLAMFGGMLFMFSMYTAKIWISCWIGLYLKTTFSGKWNKYIMYISGLFVYYLLTYIPFLGGFIGLFTAIFGLGALFLYTKETILARKDKKE